MGWAALANPGSYQHRVAKMARALWLCQQLGREAVEAKLPEMSESDQVVVRAMLDRLFPVIVH